MYQVINEVTGHRFNVKPNQAILDAALEQGVNLPYGCQKGLCGKCKGLVTGGKIAHTKPLPKGLEPAEFEAGFALMCQTQALSDVTIAVDELSSDIDTISKTYPCKVISINRLNHDVVALTLKIPSGDNMQFLAGQYIDLCHPDFESRSFSIANAPNTEGIIELHIRLVSDGQFTHFVFEQLKEKDLLTLEGPKGSFYLRNTNNPIIMIAGGTGFGPVKSMVEQNLTTQKRLIDIYWGVRDEVDLYSDLPKQWAAQYQHIRFIPVLSEANPRWQGRKGYVHQAVLNDYDDLSHADIYACGPPVMVQSVAKYFVQKGMKKTNFYSDAFEFQQPIKQ